MINTVIFDFDGTLIDTNDVILASWQHTYRHFLGHDVSIEHITKTFGEPLMKTMEREFPNVPPAESAEIYLHYQRQVAKDMVKLFPGIVEMLEAVKAEGYKIRAYNSASCGNWESDETDGLLVMLNTMGGDVEAGLAIAEMIASMKKPTVSLVLGGGHSIGVPLATAAKRSFIVPSATMTIHPVRVNGVVLGAPQTFHYFEEMQKRIVKFICEHSSSTPDIIRELMMRPDELATDIGSIIEGREAVEYGIIDEVGGLSDALAALKAMGR